MKNEQRVPGLDLLRIVSMLMVIMMHILGQGGILDAACPDSGVWYAAWGLESLCYCAVDCYGLLSGYLAGTGKHPFTRLALLWLETALYSLLFAAAFRLLRPEQTGGAAWLGALLPVTTYRYWYFTAYFGLAMVLPFLNVSRALGSERRAGLRVLALLLVFCALPTALHTDAYRLRGGYSMAWLLLLYLLGASVKQCGFLHRLGPLPLLTIAAVSFAMTAGTVFRPVGIGTAGPLTLLSYTSPTVAVTAVCLLLLFRRLPQKPGGGKLLTVLSRASFGVYILHTDPLLWQHVFTSGCLSRWAEASPALLLLMVPLCAVGVYLACCIPDYARQALMEKLRLRKRLEHWEDRLASAAARTRE